MEHDLVRVKSIQKSFENKPIPDYKNKIKPCLLITTVPAALILLPLERLIIILPRPIETPRLLLPVSPMLTTY